MLFGNDSTPHRSPLPTPAFMARIPGAINHQEYDLASHHAELRRLCFIQFF